MGTKLEPSEIGAIRFEDTTTAPVWRPYALSEFIPWDAKAYARLRSSINGIPRADARDAALQRIEKLECGKSDNAQASCDPAAEPPVNVSDWQRKLEGASVDNAAFEKALAVALHSIVCANDISAIHILRGVMRRTILESGRLFPTGREAPALVDFIMCKDCPVSRSLTDNDKAALLIIKDEEQKFAPPPESKEEK